MNPTSSAAPAPAAPRKNNGVRRVRRWLPYLGALALAALITAGLWPQPVPVETTRVTVGVLRAGIHEEAKTRVKQRYMVSAPVAGQLRRIAFKAGAEVQAGQTVVAVIDPLPPALLDERNRRLAEARRDAAAAALDKARKGHEFAASELQRFQKLFAEKTVSIQELESIQWREAAAARDRTAAESTLRQAEAELAEFGVSDATAANRSSGPVEVKAPATGRVLRVLEENARVVGAGTPLLQVGDTAELEVVIEVLSRDGAAIAPGAKVEFGQWGGPEALVGRVRLVEPGAFTKVSALGVEEQRVNVIADLLTPPEQRRGLGDNFRVEAHIITFESEQALKVASGALFRRGEQWMGFVLVDGRGRQRQVRVGRSSNTEMQVLDGLKAGEDVILYPGDRVHDGQRVRRLRVEP
jgi:HlyD family secretion protein